MNKKPELFINRIDKDLNNNEKIYYSNNKTVEKPKKKEIKKNNRDIIQKINSIFLSPNYIYKAEVRIKLKDKEIIKKIVGKNNNSLITMDNELIPINEIIDIDKK